MARLLVNIDIDDLDRAVSFYTRAFGLRVGRRFGSSGVELTGAEAPLYLLVAPAGTPPHPSSPAARDYGRHWTPVHLDFEVEDLDTALRRAVEAGARVEIPVAERRWGRIAVLSDPFGHGFCLLEFRGRGYDEIATAHG
ncbi:MAG TPA: VOC family protein [Anaeromyxobacteraceae bacterium]|nr:VOC family protein [Anaeromyxobacteraceae bacterium]